LLAGTTLHGACYALVYITAQIYVEQRVDPGWRARAQALLNLMYNGFWQPDRLSGGRLVVCHCNASHRYTMAGFLVRIGGGDGGCPDLFLAAYQGRGAGPVAKLTNQ